MTKQYTHLFSLNFELHSDNEEPTKEEILVALQQKANEMTESNVQENTEWFDTTDNEENDSEDEDEE